MRIPLCAAFSLVVALVLLRPSPVGAYEMVEIPLDDKYIVSLGAIDLDGDGTDELAVLTNYDGSTQRGQLLVYSWGSGGFHLQFISEEIGGYPYAMQIADLDSDGRDDVLVSCGGFQYFRNTADGLELLGPLFFESFGRPFAVIDLDGDGRLDIAAGGPGSGGPTVRLYRNTGSSMSYVRDLPGTTGSNLVVGCNANGDGLPDLVAAELYSGDIHVYRNQGNFDFSTTLEHTAPDRVMTIMAADFDNDGLDDFAFSQRAEQIHFFENRGSSGFHEVSVTDGDPGTYYHLLLSDLNVDGRQDVLALSFRGGEPVWFKNVRSFVFSRFDAPVAVEGDGYGLAEGDFNGDGRRDLAFGEDPLVIVFDATDLFGIPRHTYWTEIASHTAGMSGSQWRTDLVVLNASPAETTLRINLHTPTDVHTLTRAAAGHEQVVFEDVVNLMGVNGKGALEIEGYQRLLVQSRIYNQSSDGTFGQLMDGHEPGDCLIGPGDGGFFLGLHQHENLYRTNISVTNTGVGQARVMIFLFDAEGTELHRYVLVVDPEQVVQDPEPFSRRAGRPNLGWGVAIVMLIQGDDVHTSASVIDSRTNDATTVMLKRY